MPGLNSNILKCPVCKKKRGISCFLKSGWGYFVHFVSNPQLSFWIITSLKKTKNDKTISSKRGESKNWWNKFKELTLNNCSNYDVDSAFQEWIIANEPERTKIDKPIIPVIYSVETIDSELSDKGLYSIILSPNSKLAENANNYLQMLLDSLETNPDVLYADYDQIKEEKRFSPRFLMNWNRYLFIVHDYTGPLMIVKNELLYKTFMRNKFNDISELKGAIWDEVILKKMKVEHIPFILSHIVDDCSNNQRSYNDEVRNGTFENEFNNVCLKRFNENIQIAFKKEVKKPSVSIILPTSQNAVLLEKCLNSILKNTNEIEYEVILVLNNATEQVKRVITKFQSPIFKTIDYPFLFNFSDINNLAVDNAKGEYICFLNDDTEVLTENWLSSLLALAQLKDVGAVGAKLLYPDFTVQHCGVSLGINGISGHKYRGQFETIQNFVELNYLHEVSSLTAACLCVSKEKFKNVGGFDSHFSHAFNDLDFCLKLRQKGLVNLVAPYVQLIHSEGQTRGSDFHRSNSKRYLNECKLITEKWGDILKKDPYINSNLSLFNEDLRINLN